jgi:hypothetical protein
MVRYDSSSVLSDFATVIVGHHHKVIIYSVCFGTNQSTNWSKMS